MANGCSPFACADRQFILRIPDMFKKVLIANRGEIALRVIFACKELGIRTVAVFSEADRDALHVRFADEAICIGPSPSVESYLNIPSVISGAELTNADAIHPGYGFLSENAHFAEVCEECGIAFIGPSPANIRVMGDKAKAREALVGAGLEALPGSPGPVDDPDEALSLANDIGYPVIVKASAGGGGRGMRVVRERADFLSAFETARAEATAAFGSSDCYLEKYIEKARHIEFQVLADDFGGAIHLGERECSIQRRHQKLIEEAPSVIMNDDLRARMGEKVVAAVLALGYTNVGTIEFLVDEQRRFYFMEMNTRIQVEHGVTEMVTGIDLLRDQILVAAGEKLPHSQSDVGFRGHAIECRVNAENPFTQRPSPGKITSWHPPGGPGVRVDTAAYAEYVVPPYYDSLIAKVLAQGANRDEALRRMDRALRTFIIEGIETSIPLHLQILEDEQFRSGDIFTTFLERRSQPQGASPA
jgi:acetyl-CoA carboxylase biotin carboxylase subunit